MRHRAIPWPIMMLLAASTVLTISGCASAAPITASEPIETSKSTPDSRPEGAAAVPAPESQPEADTGGLQGRWHCRNDLEIYCRDAACEVAELGEFTPMDVSLGMSGDLSVCAYTGCWEGRVEVLERQDFLVAVGQDLPFSSAKHDRGSDRDVVLVIDRGDSVATLKVGVFALPLLCSRSEP